MRKSVFLSCLLACGTALLLGAGCGDDGGGGAAGGGAAGSTPGSGTGGGGSGGGGGGVPPDDALNPDCPVNTAAKPYDGPYGMKGDCCYRTSNTSRLNKAPDKATLEFRLSYFNPINHPKTISGPIIVPATVQRFEKEEQHILYRFVVPMKDGMMAAGEGTATIGAGRYNCDGTYSFYNDKAATPSGGNTDPARWAATPVKIIVDPTKTKWEEQAKTVWETNVNRRPSFLPYVLQSGDKPLEWEAGSQGFNIIDMPAIKDAINCVGDRPDDHTWVPGGKTVSYQRLDINNKSAITVLGNISLAQLQAFGASIGPKKDDPMYDVLKATRCAPGSANCQWVKLPDSLCPANDKESSEWGCHVGDVANEDMVKTNCTMTAPTGVLDPDKGATSEGQCCDPLATKKDGLPDCNAYRLVSEFVAGAVEITDAAADKLQPNCEK